MKVINLLRKFTQKTSTTVILCVKCRYDSGSVSKEQDEKTTVYHHKMLSEIEFVNLQTNKVTSMEK